MPPRKRKAPGAEVANDPEPSTTTNATRKTKKPLAANAKTTTTTTKTTATARPATAAAAAAAAPAPDAPAAVPAPARVQRINAVHAVVKKAQASEAFHTKYTKELQHIYAQLGHDRFVPDYQDTIQQLLLCEDAQTYATVGLKFLAKFATAFNAVDTHPLLVYTFDWLLDTVSVSPVIRFRICQFVNLLLNALSNDAALDFAICENVVKYMIDRMKDVSASVRVQALNAMQRLQSPDDREDKICKIYQLHLNADPSPLVRQAIITSICRNQHTIPFILERFWDVDDKVRRHAYLHMCTYSVKSYRVVQRLQFIEQGLVDHSESVRKVVTNVLLPAWLEAYNRDYIQFVAALKLDANEADIERFRKAARLALAAIFKKQRVGELIASLPLHTVDSDADLAKCIPLDQLSVESALYWHALIEHVRAEDEEHGSDELDAILPEMSTFCVYIARYFEFVNVNAMDKWQRLEHHYVLLTLCEIIDTFDMSDELGRNRLQQVICEMLSREQLDEAMVAKAVHCLDRIVPDVNDRLQLVADTIRTVVDANSATLDLSSAAVVELLGRDSNLNFRVSSMKLRIMELEEQERDCITQKEYGRAEKLRGELNECSDALASLIAQHLRGEGDSGTSAAGGSSEATVLPLLRRVSIEDTMRCIQMACYVVRSTAVRSLNPAMVRVFKDFVRRHMEGKHMHIRDQALKCGISFAMLYEQLAKDVYAELFAQFFKHTQTQIWATAISGIFELIDRYGFEHFEEEHSENGESEAGSNATASGITAAGGRTSSGGGGGVGARYNAKNMTRQLYSSNLDSQTDGAEGDGDLLMQRRNADIMLVLDHFLDDCAESYIQRALIDGYCRLLLRGHISGSNYVSRMLLKYFNPMTEPEITQILGIFFEKLIALQRQECLQEAMLTTLFTVLDSPPESPLQEIQPESILRFVITSTRPMNSSPGLNIHNTIAMSFLDVMSDNTDNKDLLRLLVKAFAMLDVAVDDVALRRDLFTGLDQLLDGNRLEPRTETAMRLFKQKMVSAAEEADGRLTGTFCSTANAVPVAAETVGTEDHGDDDDDVDEEPDDVLQPANRSGADADGAEVEERAADASTDNVPSSPAAQAPADDSPPTTPTCTEISVVVPETPSPLAMSPINSRDDSNQRSRRFSRHKSTATPTSKTSSNENETGNATVNADNSAQLSSNNVDENVESSTPKRKATRSTRIATSRAELAGAAPSARTTRSTTTTKVARGKRRNDMVTKSPSPRSLSTVSKQTSKRSRIVTLNGSTSRATAAKTTTTVTATVHQPATPLMDRPNVELVRNVLTPEHTRLINEMTSKHRKSVVLGDVHKSIALRRTSRLMRLEQANEKTTTALSNPATRIAPMPTESLPGSSSARTTAPDKSSSTTSKPDPTAARSNSRRTLDRLRNVSVVLSPVHARLINEMTANQTTTVLLGDIRRAETAGHGSSNEPTKSSSPPKETATTATQSARSSDPDDRSAAKKRPAAAQRSALPLRVAATTTRPAATATKPTTSSSSSSASSTSSDTEQKQPPRSSVKYPKVKLHRIGQLKRLQRPNNVSSSAASAVRSESEAVRHRTRGVTAQEIIQNNIITRNRRSIENIVSLTQIRRSFGAAASTAALNRTIGATPKAISAASSQRNAAAVPLRSNNVATAQQRGTRIPRPTKK